MVDNSVELSFTSSHSHDNNDSSIIILTENEVGGGEETILADNNSTKTLKLSSGLKKMGFYQNLRHQLTEQLKSLESRLEAQLLLTSELQDYFKRRSEVELEFSKMLDKTYKGSIALKKKDSGQWAPSMLSTLMLNFLNETKKEAKERFVLSEICGLIVNRLGLIQEDLQRIFKQCQIVCLEGQEELVKVLQELYLSSKSFQTQNAEWKQAETKLKHAENQKSKAEVGLSKEKIEKSKKVKGLEKEVQKRLRKATDAKFKAMKAKNEYILCMDAANAAVQKYFVEDLSDLIDCMDLGFYESISTCLKLYVFSEEIKKDSLATTIEQLNKLLTSLDSRVDKQKFLEMHNSAFVLPKKFEFHQFLTEPDDSPPTLETPPILGEELEQRMFLLERRLCTLKIESNELWKTLETAESTLLSLIDENWSCNVMREWFAVGGISNNTLLSDGKEGNHKIRSDRVETDQFHINKYRDWMLATSKSARLNAKYEHIKNALGVKRASTISDEEINSSEKMKRRKRIGQRISTNCKLFGGSIEEYLEANKCEIPLIIKSCVRVVNLFGMHHQGIFRVSGSQVEINNFRDAFERGEDPLCELTDASDINSVASLLKLYLRELREPIFPLVFFDYFMDVAQLDNEQLFIHRMKEFVMKNLPRPIFTVLRYLFHFLNHLSEYNEENMMDPYNLAICFGPTLVPVPDDKDQVQFQNLVNELIKNVIVFAHEIFHNEVGGETYRRYSDDATNASTRFMTLSTNSATTDEEENSTTDDPLDDGTVVGVALYDFKARSPRELNLKKGQKLKLVTRVSSDWWKGKIVEESNGESIGLIPHKYIEIDGVFEHNRRGPPSSTSSLGATTPPPHAKKLSISEPPLTPTELHHPHHQHKLSTSSTKFKLPPVEDSPSSSSDQSQVQAQPSCSYTSTTMIVANVETENVKHNITTTSLASSASPNSHSSASASSSNRLSLETKFTPDLVLDLPNLPSTSSSSSGSSSSSSATTPPLHGHGVTNNVSTTVIPIEENNTEKKESSSSPTSSSSSDSESEVTVVTGAEVFAKQNQCTLKKIHVAALKPKVMAKPKLPKSVVREEECHEEEEEEDEKNKNMNSKD